MRTIDSTTPARPPQAGVAAHAIRRPAGSSATRGRVANGSATRSERRRLGRGRNRRDTPGATGATLSAGSYSRGDGGTPSAGSAAFSRKAISSRLTRFRRGTSSRSNQRASSLEPSTSLRSSPPTTLAR